MVSKNQKAIIFLLFLMTIGFSQLNPQIFRTATSLNERTADYYISNDVGVQLDGEVQYVSSQLLARKAQVSPEVRLGKPDSLSQAFTQLQKYKLCSDCDNFRYFSFKAGTAATSFNSYLTVSSSCSGSLYFQNTTAPGTNHLFIGKRMFDTTWVLEPLACPGKYLRASWPSSVVLGSSITWLSRFWFERHSDHTHIESAAFVGSWWSGSTNLTLLNGGASSYIIQHWPDRPWP